MALQDCCVLVVEDEYLVADLVESALLEHGATVIGPAATVESALRMLEGPKRIDAAVLDISLKGDMTFVVADALTARGVPFVFITGFSSQIIPPRHRNIPVWQKPFMIEDLIQALPLLLRR